MPEPALTHLRVLIANEKRDRLELLAAVMAGLRHDVIAREIYGAAINAVAIVAGVHSTTWAWT